MCVLQALNIGAPAPTEAIDIAKVFEILNRHVDKLDPLRAVEEIPADISLKKLERFLTRLLETQNVNLSKVCELRSEEFSESFESQRNVSETIRFLFPVAVATSAADE